MSGPYYSKFSQLSMRINILEAIFLMDFLLLVPKFQIGCLKKFVLNEYQPIVIIFNHKTNIHSIKLNAFNITVYQRYQRINKRLR